MNEGYDTKLASLLALAAAWAITACAPESGAPPHILLVTLDTTRADHLGCYGYARDTSPNLDALAAEATTYTAAYSTSSWTLPAHASLFTGKLPASHGARYDPQGPLQLADAIAARRGLRARGLARAEHTLAERLAEAGYATAGVVGGPWLKRLFGLDQGFAFYDDAGITRQRGRPADQVSDVALRWLAGRDERPFFLFLNYFDPHHPYAPPAPYADRFGHERPPPHGAAWRKVANYDGEIRYMDDQLGRVLGFLREQGLWERTLIAVTADHGELFGEHGRLGHGEVLFEELVRVPLLVKPAGRSAPRTDASPIQIVALLPRLLEAAGLPRPVAAGEPTTRMLAEVRAARSGDDRADWQALWQGSEKLHRSSDGRLLRFDLARDPREQRDLSREDPARTTALAAQLDADLAGLPPPILDAGEAPTIDRETLRALEELGYLD